MTKPYLVLKSLILLALPALLRAEFKYWDPQDTATVPKTLSDMGLYVDIHAPIKVLLPNAYRYEVNTPLWSDDAHKTRWILVPANRSIEFDLQNDVWKYPDSTVFIKQFAIDTIMGDSTSRILWETRILINKKKMTDSVTKRTEDIWYASTYKWNVDQKDAKRIDFKQSLNDSVRVYPSGNRNTSKLKKWRFLSQNECNQCHRVGKSLSQSDSGQGRAILGFFTVQLNLPHSENPSLNQLQYFFERGILTGSAPTDWNASWVPRWAALSQTTVSIDQRARAYLAANCSGCHGLRGIKSGATVQGQLLNFDFHTMAPQMELRYQAITIAYGLDTLAPFFYNKKSDSIANPKQLENLMIVPALVVPGYPEKSLLWLRLTNRNTADTGSRKFDRDLVQMPPIGSYAVDLMAKDLIAQWISEMTPLDRTPKVGIPFVPKQTLLKSPFINGHTLYLPLEISGRSQAKILLISLKGRATFLNSIGPGRYAIPRTIPPGVYLIRLNKQSYIRQLF